VKGADGDTGTRTRERLAAILDSLGVEPSEPSPCPYLPGRAARLVLLRPRSFTPGLYHAFMDLNFRRVGWGVYRPQCDGCAECRQLRVFVPRFRPDRAQRRCLARNRDVVVTTGDPEPTREKHAVYRRYLDERHRGGEMTGSWREFCDFLYEAPSFARETVYRVGGRLLGAGIVDVEPEAMSAVYFYFDPDLGRRSPGTFNVLWLLEECRRLSVPWLYLGYHVAGSRTMSYKAAYRPHEILGSDGGWR
jgi:arginyl-tRNA--protein-N-Asp/Glu arginylyltransferase